ncbi:MAG: hypothetical protein ACYTGV_01075 [Planctomycetota bacterium]
MLALSTRCAPPDLPLERVVRGFRDLSVPAIALHRPAEPEEARALAALAHGLRIVAVFGERTGGDLGRPILVVEGGVARTEDREASLEALCRRLFALREFPVAVRTPMEAGDHPAPEEIALIRSELGGVGYWHDPARGGAAYLDAAARWLMGASFHPLEEEDLAAIRDALPASAPAVIDCPETASKEEIREALARARSFFRA